jgi:hypothetical protein
MANLPLHLAVLDKLLSNVETRTAQHRVKVGVGMEDREYQRHVGRITEGVALSAEIEDLRKRLLRDEDLFDDQDEDTPNKGTARVKARNRRS